MEKVLWSIIAASALCAASSHVKRQYHFVNEQKNQAEALSYCREKYTDLATIDNMEDMNILKNMVELNKMVYSEYSHGAWIGLYYDPDSWRWSLSNGNFYKHGEAEFRRWMSGQPHNTRGPLCTAMLDTGLWKHESCDQPFKAVCSDVRGPNVTFVLTDTSMTWTEAQSHCRALYTDLASVRNTSENQKVRELVPAGQEVWIGLFRDSWKWSDGSNSSFRYWNEDIGEPNNDLLKKACVAADFDRSGKWMDWDCNFKATFICYSVPVSQQVIRVRMKKSSSVDLNDPAVMEDILKQLKQRLKDQGVNENIRLSWRKQADGKIFHKDKEETKRRSRKGGQKEEL